MNFGLLSVQRILQIVAGLGFWSSLSWVGDNIAFPAVIAWKGLLLGGLAMSLISIFITALFLMVYEYKKIDWMGMDVLHDIRNNGLSWAHTYYARHYDNAVFHYGNRALFFLPMIFSNMLTWMLQKGDAFAFVALSILSDPFVTTIYLRHGRFDGLKKKDWGIFLCSGVLANMYWTLRSYGVVVAASYALHVF